jgi:rhodanese-related sulfurtransferase
LEFIQQNIYLVAIALVSGLGLLVLTFRRPGDRNSLSATQATQLINREGALVIDVRESDEYVSGHLPESRNIPAGQLGDRVGELDGDKDKPLILVCQTGSRSTGACKQLIAQGFARVHNLEGGIAGWRAAGLPLKKGTKK